MFDMQMELDACLTLECLDGEELASANVDLGIEAYEKEVKLC